MAHRTSRTLEIFPTKIQRPNTLVTEFHNATNATVEKTTTVGGLQKPAEEMVDFFTDEQRELSDLIQRNLSLVAIAISLPLTVCNIIVFLQKDMRSATSTYVIGLSIAQILYLLRRIVDRGLHEGLAEYHNNQGYWAFFLYYDIYVCIVARRGSYVVSCLVSMERLYAVLRPLHIKDFFLSKRPLLCLVITYSVSAILHVYILTKFEVAEVVDSVTGRTVHRMRFSELYIQQKDINNSFGILAKAVLTFASLPCQLVLNVLTVWALRRHNKTTKHVSSSVNEEEKMKKERQLTVTILATTVGYLILTIPWALNTLCISIFTEYWELGKYKNTFWIVSEFAGILTYISSGVDFICFLWLSSNYRRTFYRLFGIRVGKKQFDDNMGDGKTESAEFTSDYSKVTEGQ